MIFFSFNYVDVKYTQKSVYKRPATLYSPDNWQTCTKTVSLFFIAVTIYYTRVTERLYPTVKMRFTNRNVYQILAAEAEIGSISSRCSENEPALLPRGGTKSGRERVAEIEPKAERAYMWDSRRLSYWVLSCLATLYKLR